MALIPATVAAREAAEGKDPAGFCIDRFEYPNRKGVRPLCRVSWKKAAKLCRKHGRRLCTPAEWEQACRGPEDLPFPYGKEHNPETCHTDAGWKGKLSASGASGNCVSGYGVWDMVGNLWEWTEGERSAEREQRILKGGSWGSRGEKFASCSAEVRNYKGIKLRFYGFRCCKDLPASTP